MLVLAHSGLLSFQFYLSSIKSIPKLLLHTLYERFNSTLVQLKVVWSSNRTCSQHCFNSTLVQLKGVLTNLVMSALHCFNSTLVQLKASVYRPVTGSIMVSILP